MPQVNIRRSLVERAARTIRRLSRAGTPERFFTITETERAMGLTKPERNAVSDLLVSLSASDGQAFGRTPRKRVPSQRLSHDTISPPPTRRRRKEP